MNNDAALLQMRRITKEFPGMRALDEVTFDLRNGEFHSLVGENGAGKSTLMKVLSGVYGSGTYSGEIVINGAIKQFAGIKDSADAGVAVIFQELSLVKELTVGENIFLGREPSRFGVIDWGELYLKASQLLSELNLSLNPRTKVGSLGIGQQQLVEIAKALSQKANILVLDEPTAALTESEVGILFDILRGLLVRGVGMIYISHKLDEVFEMSDRITVLRDGKTIGTYRAADLTKTRVIELMVGREISNIFPESLHERGAVALEVKNLTAADPERSGKNLIHNVSFKVRQGEIVGIAGLMGAGRSELLMSIFGAHDGRVSGEIFVAGKKIFVNSPADAIKNGIGFVTEDRKRFGLMLDQIILNNVTLAGLKNISGRFLTNQNREFAAGEKAKRDLRVKTESMKKIVGNLSGGNQQKVVLAKWLLTNPKVLFLDEPTRGIDVGAKQEIYAQINELAQQGLAIVLVSSELPEVLGLSDRILVLHNGRINGEFTRAEAAPEKVMAAATGNL